MRCEERQVPPDGLDLSAWQPLIEPHGAIFIFLRFRRPTAKSANAPRSVGSFLSIHAGVLRSGRCASTAATVHRNRASSASSSTHAAGLAIRSRRSREIRGIRHAERRVEFDPSERVIRNRLLKQTARLSAARGLLENPGSARAEYPEEDSFPRV